MRCEKGVRGLAKRMVAFQRFAFEDIEAGCEGRAFGEGIGQGARVDKPSTGCIHDDGVRLHGCETRCIHKVPCFVCEREVEREDIRLGEQFLNGEFDDTEEKQEIEFEVTGSRFQQGDESIVVLGKLRNVVRPAEEEPVESNEMSEPLLAAPVSGSGTESDKRVVTVNVASTKAAEQMPRRRRLNQTQEKKTNE